jgi:tRNA-Thr(GGU) m(6)t(6)A37 methyltransferase TsaA
MNEIEVRPVGVVCSADDATLHVPLQGNRAVIEIFPEYVAALERIDEYSHLWIQSWFHEAKRDVLATVPSKVNPDLPRYGVFALRSPLRPNPIALTLVTLDRVEGNRLFVNGLDAVDGTPILDIKPYFEQDIVFSPRTARITAAKREVRKNLMEREALLHHREACADLRIAVRMALIAEESFGKLNDDELKVDVTGSPCLGDVIQGLTRARLANPPRFLFRPCGDTMRCAFLKNERKLVVEVRDDVDTANLDAVSDEDVFRITEG